MSNGLFTFDALPHIGSTLEDDIPGAFLRGFLKTRDFLSLG